MENFKKKWKKSQKREFIRTAFLCETSEEKFGDLYARGKKVD